MRFGLTRVIVLGGAWGLATTASAQVPDLLNALDAGGRSMGVGGATNATNADTLSSYYNPAGLGYLDKPQVSLAIRNLPKSKTLITGSYADPVRDSRGESGNRALSHAGYALPLSQIFKKARGTLAFSYTLGGYIDDVGNASSLPDGSRAFTIADYQERIHAQADFYSLSYGRAVGAGNFSYGFGLIYLQQKVSLAQDGTSPIGFTPFSLGSTGDGFGAIVGVQYNPPGMPNLGVGASLRTPINLSHNAQTAALYDRVPGRFLAGAAYRWDGFRRGKDYLVGGIDFQYFFGGRGSLAFDQDDQLVTSLGLEYCYGLPFGRLPIRLGYVSVPGSGEFGDRNSLTYGIGYKPNIGDYRVDLAWANPKNGGHDFSISANYRFR